MAVAIIPGQPIKHTIKVLTLTRNDYAALAGLDYNMEEDRLIIHETPDTEDLHGLCVLMDSLGDFVVEQELGNLYLAGEVEVGVDKEGNLTYRKT